MANNKVDIGQILAEAKAKAAAAKKQADAAAAVAARKQAQGENAARIKMTITRNNDRVKGLQGFIDDDMNALQQIVNQVVASGGTPTPAQQRDLEMYQKRINSSIAEQQRLSDEVSGLTNGSLVVDKTGKVIPLKSDSAVPTVATPAAPAAAPAAKGKGTTTTATTATPKATTATPAATAKTVTPTATTATPKATTATTNASTSPVTGGIGGTQTPSATTGKEKVPAATDTEGLTAAQEKKLGTYGSKYLINYFSSNSQLTVPNPYGAKHGPISIYEYLKLAAQHGESATNVEAVLKNSNWYTDVNERYRAPIAAAALANGITLDSTQIDNYRDQVINGVRTVDEIKYQLGQQAINKFQLTNSKPEIARLISAGKTLAEAVSGYAAAYAQDMGLDATQVEVTDPKFLTLVTSSTSLDDFQKKVRRTPEFLSRPDVQNSIAANVATLQQKYATYGQSNLDSGQLWNLAQNLYLNDTSMDVIDKNLREAAAKEFSPFRDRILAGEDPTSIAAPYISSMSRILEIAPSALSLNDPSIRRAMQGTTTTKGETTSSTAAPIWQFEQDLYKDPRWQYTTNAHEKMDSITLDVLSRFGLVG